MKLSHPEWLGKNVKGAIPDLSDIGDLMWIETTLAGKSLPPGKRTELEALRKKALAGTLARSDLRAFKAEGKPTKDALAAFLSTLQALRRKAGGVPGMPPEALAHLDAAISIARHETILKVAGIRRMASRSAA